MRPAEHPGAACRARRKWTLSSIVTVANSTSTIDALRAAGSRSTLSQVARRLALLRTRQTYQTSSSSIAQSTMSVQRKTNCGMRTQARRTRGSAQV